MAHVFCLFNRRHSIENHVAEDALTAMLIDGEITYTEGGEVLEEVSALTRVYTVVVQADLYYQF